MQAWWSKPLSVLLLLLPDLESGLAADNPVCLKDALANPGPVKPVLAPYSLESLQARQSSRSPVLLAKGFVVKKNLTSTGPEDAFLEEHEESSGSAARHAIQRNASTLANASSLASKSSKGDPLEDATNVGVGVDTLVPGVTEPLSGSAERSPFWTPEKFTDFHDDGGPMVELIMQKLALRELHVRSQGSITRFLLSLRKELADSAGIPEARIGIREIFGRYQLPMEAPMSSSVRPLNDQDFPEDRKNEEVVVRLQVLGGEGLHPTEVLDMLRTMLHDENSKLRAGSLKVELMMSDLVPSQASVLRPASDTEGDRGTTRLSSMALPIGVSAVFTGILIWLAAW